MVRLTMTPAIVAAIEEAQRSELDLNRMSEASEPPLGNPVMGNPISHGQIIALSELSRQVKSGTENDDSGPPQGLSSYHLDDLLRGARIYEETPKPRAEPVSLRGTKDMLVD